MIVELFGRCVLELNLFNISRQCDAYINILNKHVFLKEVLDKFSDYLELHLLNVCPC